MSDFFKAYQVQCEILRKECDEQVKNGELTEDEAAFRYDMVKDEILMSMSED